MASSARIRNPRGEGTRLKQDIVDAAIALIDAGDTPVVPTLRGVARQAGVSAPAIYAHFADLQAVMDAVLARSFAELHAAVARAAQSHPDPVDALVAVGGVYLDFAWSRAARYRLMFDGAGYAPNALASFAVVEDLITRAAADGVSASLAPRLDAWMVWAGLHGVATLQKPRRPELLRLGPLDRRAMVETMIRRLARVGDPGG